MRSTRSLAGRAATALGLLACVALAACYDDVKVVQGTVTAVDATGRALDLRDERPPHATATYGGVEPAGVASGDLVRVAFRDHPDGKQVVRLMNLTRHRARDRSEKK
jgi:hypothetical protein